MSIAKLERWLKILPAHERTQFVTIVDGVKLTPEDILREARGRTEIGRKALSLFMSGGIGTEEELLVERVKRRLGRYPSDKPLFHILGTPNMLTPSDILANIEEGTVTGKKWIDAEGRYLEYLDKLRERV